MLYFNPRSREGSDLSGGLKGCRRPRISIHAPAKGATAWAWVGNGGLQFQSTLPRRERPGNWERVLMLNKFQSTLPRRERLFVNSYRYRILQFQSTLPRRERPRLFLLPKTRRAISIHAPAKGATLHLIRRMQRPCRFQSTLPRRERR